MDLEVIDMPRSAARKAAAEYLRAVRDRHDDEDAQILRGYRELVKGRQLIRLSDTIRQGGCELRSWRRGGRPLERTVTKLAVARADAKLVRTTCVGEAGGVTFCWHPDPQPDWRRNRRGMAHNNARDVLAFRGVFDTHDGRHADSLHWGQMPIRAIVPTVPPRLRPAHHLRNYFLLWEAEWGVDPSPPVDPALIKHIGGDLWAVLAVWDLTDVERAVLAGR